MKKLKGAICAAALATGIFLAGCAQIGDVLTGFGGENDETRVFYPYVAAGGGQSVQAVAVTEAVSGSATEYFMPDLPDTRDDSMAPYEKYGITYDENNGMHWFCDLPLGALYDTGHMTLLNGYYFDIGALVIVDRDENDNIKALRPVDKQTMAEMIGAGSQPGSLEEKAWADGLAYYEEDISIKGMGSQQLYETELAMRVKYKNQNAIIRLNDYVLDVGKKDMLGLSAYCTSANNDDFGVKVYAKYELADEIDLALLDEQKTEQAVFAVLRAEKYTDKAELEEDVKAAIAKLYGMSTNNLIVEVDQVDRDESSAVEAAST